ncbi:hypothetical protein MVES1_001580 [Malassezia vespertilionis]|uniref:uncharacterized protein n=1 Tax=Malassezia vespertilionis TaxID=2020962 RepID=UPI0024B0D3E8|nr:uncharacterized protein MVES1_001580 [Malassezia vespertilionis]WFD06237.1 hypothetical protein MVES1_001580 [Malassezia vespertilionis]
MVLFYTSAAVDPPVTLYMGRDKVENIPDPLLEDCAQLVKANSIQGNKKNNITIIYTPHANVKKTGDMAVGAVTFFNDQRVKRFYVKERENAIVNRLNKTRVERQIDYAAERQERERALGRKKKEFALQQVCRHSINDEKREITEAKQRRNEDASARDYSSLYSEEAIAEKRREDQRRARIKSATKPKPADDVANLLGTGVEDAPADESDDSFM